MITLVKNIKLSNNFSAGEFVCPGTDDLLYDYLLIQKLQELRDAIKEPLYIASGYRTIEYNKRIGGANRSQHTMGKAADIKATKTTPFELLQIAEQIGFGGIGIYNTWLHVDTRTGHSRWYKRDHVFSNEIMTFIKSLNYKSY